MDEDALQPPIFKKSTKPKKSSKLRLALNDDDAGQEQGGDSTAPEVFRPKKNVKARAQNLTRLNSPAIERKSVYSHDYLQQLRESTPVRKNEPVVEVPDDYQGDLTHKQVEPGPRPADKDELPETVIPDESTIRHLKEEREVRRRAGENYIPLSDALTSRDHSDRESRLQTEDAVDDMGDGTEGLQGYESDSMPLGAQNQARAAREKRQEMEEMILERQGLLDDPYAQEVTNQYTSPDSSDSDDEWERTQTGKSVSMQHSDTSTRSRPVVPEFKPIMTVPQLLQKIRQQTEAARQAIETKRAAIIKLEEEQVEIAEREESIKANLQRTSLAYETARLKIGGIEALSDL